MCPSERESLLWPLSSSRKSASQNFEDASRIAAVPSAVPDGLHARVVGSRVTETPLGHAPLHKRGTGIPSSKGTLHTGSHHCQIQLLSLCLMQVCSLGSPSSPSRLCRRSLHFGCGMETASAEANHERQGSRVETISEHHKIAR